MKAIIVAGGRGERLRPLTDTVPKPMIEVGGKPILEHIVLQLKNAGIEEFIFCICYLPEKIVEYFGDGSRWGIDIQYVYEDVSKPMGTAGATKLTEKYIEGTFLVTYADVLRTLDIVEMIKFHQKNKSYATIAVYENPKPNPKSRVVFDSDNRILAFQEHPHSNNLNYWSEINNNWSNASLYILEGQILQDIPAGRMSDFAIDIFPSLLKNKKTIMAYPISNQFIDIGNMKKLQSARSLFSK